MRKSIDITHKLVNDNYHLFNHFCHARIINGKFQFPNVAFFVPRAAHGVYSRLVAQSIELLNSCRKRRESIRCSESKRRRKHQQQLDTLKNLLFSGSDKLARITREEILEQAIQVCTSHNPLISGGFSIQLQNATSSTYSGPLRVIPLLFP